MDVSTLKQFLSSIHTYKGLNKLDVFSDNKMKNKPLKWWLEQMDSTPASDEPFNINKFSSTYRILSSKKIRSAEYLNEVLDWASNNKPKFRAGLQNDKMVQYRQSITKNEKLEQEREQEAAEASQAEETKKAAYKTIASFLNKQALTEYQEHVSDEIGHLLKTQEDFKDLPDIMDDVVEKWHAKKANMTFDDLDSETKRIAPNMKKKGYNYIAQVTTINGDFGDPLFFKNADLVGPFLRSFPEYEKAKIKWSLKLD